MLIVHRDYRDRPNTVTVKMTLQDFREYVEWFENVAPTDGATRDWREWLDEIDPPAVAFDEENER